MYLPFSMSIKLENRIAVITGATSGMALAATKIFVEEGAYVFITGRSQERLDNAIKEIGKNVIGVQCNAGNLADLERVFDIVKNEKGRIDVLFVSTVFYTVFVVVYNEEYTIKRVKSVGALSKCLHLLDSITRVKKMDYIH
jgi:NAD(P)-dependent dehydrogenase (short-subunit alcohol dehydrogenase family)